MKLKEILEQCVKTLKENDIPEATNKARRILAFLLNVDKEYLIINYEQEIREKDIQKINEYINQLAEGKPIQYIVGKQEFMGIDFMVNEKVLIPQPDTEILVEKTIEILKKYAKPSVLDLCTGSGAIAISISHYIPESEVYASDISKEALQIAKLNDKNNKIKFIVSNLFQDIENKFDVIVSNPPYIRSDEIKLLSKEVQNEPLIALDGGKDGLNFYREIIEQAPSFLKPKGYLCLEIGDEQLKMVTNIIKQTRHYENIKAYKDLGGNDRVIIANSIQ